jgi:hypothetical protein
MTVQPPQPNSPRALALQALLDRSSSVDDLYSDEPAPSGGLGVVPELQGVSTLSCNECLAAHLTAFLGTERLTLQGLTLSRNQLTPIPGEITELSGEIAGLSPLHTLNLEGNQLTMIPPRIEQLLELQEIPELLQLRGDFPPVNPPPATTCWQQTLNMVMAAASQIKSKILQLVAWLTRFCRG